MYDIYALTETWLTSSIFSNECFPESYQIFRNDNDVSVSGKSRGGGVLIALNSNFSVISKPDLYSSRVSDALGLKLICRGKVYYICVFYIQPSATCYDYDELLNFFQSVFSQLDTDLPILMFGDLNLPDYGNFVNDQIQFAKLKKQTRDFCSFCDFFELTSFNKVLNSMNRCLDVAISNLNLKVSKSLFELVKEDAYHPALLVEVKTFESSSVPQNVKDVLKYDFSKGDYLKLYQLFADCDFTDIARCCNVDDATSYFYKKVYTVLDECIPKKRSYFNPKYPPWFTKKLISLSKKKCNLYKKIKKSHKRKNNNCNFLIDKFSHLKQELKKGIDSAYKRFAMEAELQLRKDPKKLWSFTRSKMGKNNLSHSASMEFDGNTLTDPTLIAEGFAKLFQSAFKEPSKNVQSSLPVVGCKTTYFHMNDVLNAIQRLKNSKSLGPDLLPVSVLKGCAEFLATPLSFIFNMCLRSGTFPSQWKISRVVPVHKKGSRSLGLNHRPVSILSCPSKVLEILVSDDILSNTKADISIYQHGFVKGRSTVSNLLCFSNYVSCALNSGLQVDAVYFDFSKAFDTIDHPKLIEKLTNLFRIPLYLINFLQSYLLNRVQFVSYCNAVSNIFKVVSGVPQGSILGPLLFVLFINDLTTELQGVSSLVYADDVKLFKAVTCTADAIMLQQNIDKIHNWSQSNLLSLNAQKCCSMSYGIQRINHKYRVENDELQKVSEYKDLGVTFDSCLSFKTHILNQTKRAFQILGFVRRMSSLLQNTETVKLLYNALVRSHLEYASLIWNPSRLYLVDHLEKVQRYFLRYIYFKKTRTFVHYRDNPVSTSELLKMFDMVTLESRRKNTDIICFYKILHHLIDVPQILESIRFRVPSSNIRSPLLFDVPLARHNQFSNSPLVRMLRVANDINQDIFSTTLAKLRINFKK